MEELTCPSCLELYNDPQLLLCGHSTCLSCIEKITTTITATNSNSTQQVVCAFCRAITPRGQVAPSIEVKNRLNILYRTPGMTPTRTQLNNHPTQSYYSMLSKTNKKLLHKQFPL